MDETLEDKEKDKGFGSDRYGPDRGEGGEISEPNCGLRQDWSGSVLLCSLQQGFYRHKCLQSPHQVQTSQEEAARSEDSALHGAGGREGSWPRLLHPANQEEDGDFASSWPRLLHPANQEEDG